MVTLFGTCPGAQARSQDTASSSRGSSVASATSSGKVRAGDAWPDAGSTRRPRGIETRGFRKARQARAARRGRGRRGRRPLPPLRRRARLLEPSELDAAVCGLRDEPVHCPTLGRAE